MSRLDELIKELCPDGVEYRKLESCCNILDRKRKPIAKGSRISGEYPYYGANGVQDYVNDYIFDGKFVLVGEDGSVITSNGTPVVTWAIGKIWVNNHAHVISEKDDVLLRYLFHYIQTINVTDLIHGNIPKLTGTDFKALQIAVPPLAVQKEIVRILNSFTEYTALLEKELALRKKQYAYYRDMLLDFGSVHRRETYECEWRTLGEVIISLNTGLNPRKFFKLNTEDATNYYITICEIRNGKITPNNKTDRINNNALQLCNNRSNLEVGDVLFSGTGTVGETAVITKKPTNWNIKEGVYSIKPIQTKILPFFLYYILQTEKIKTAYMKKVAGGTVKSIPMVEMKKILIPVPSLEEQKRIVGILDRFDRLCNDLTSGLPAEINARQKQYAYYRDKLLSFQRKEL
ncbi:MAG: restriction endonuclease subunit S [Oscillospiraceae bacterium]|nr:restriction endonuclease subunit S [Oscillospiraceae bacterium]